MVFSWWRPARRLSNSRYMNLNCVILDDAWPDTLHEVVLGDDFEFPTAELEQAQVNLPRGDPIPFVEFQI